MDEYEDMLNRAEENVINSGSRMMHAVREKGYEASQRVNHYMHEHPVRSVVIAAVAGAALGAVAASMRFRRRGE